MKSLNQIQKDQILSYLKIHPRNKIVIHKKPITSLPSLNIGNKLAMQINNIKDHINFSLDAKSKLDSLFTSKIVRHKEYGNVLAIHNLGILFEAELKINFQSLIEKYSRDTCLFIQWDGEIKGDKLYFLSREKGIEINLKNLSHIKI